LPTYLERLESRISAIRILRAIKRFETYSKMSRQFDLPTTVLSRYVKGHVLPSLERSYKIVKLGLPIFLNHIYDSLRASNFRRLEIDPEIVSVLTEFFVLRALAGKRITTIIPISPESILLASLIARRINKRLLIPRAFRKPKQEVREIPVNYGVYFSQSLYVHSHVLKGGFRGDSVLLVSISLMEDRPIADAFVEFLRKRKINLAGVFAIIAPPWEYDYEVIAVFKAGR